MDYIAIIRKFIEGVIREPEKVTIEELESDSKKDRIFFITCTKEDTGRLIGKHGSTADALREVVSIAAKNNNERVHIKLGTYED